MQWINVLRIVLLPVRALQILFAAGYLGLCAYLISSPSANAGAQLYFSCFVGALTILSGIFLVLTQLVFQHLANVWFIFVVEVLHIILWWVAWVWIVVPQDMAGWGNGPIYNDLRAAVSLGALTWLLFIFTAVVAIINIVHRHRHPNGTQPMPYGQGQYAVPVQQAPGPQGVPAPEMRPVGGQTV